MFLRPRCRRSRRTTVTGKSNSWKFPQRRPMSVSYGYAPRTAAPASVRRGLFGRLLGHHSCGSACGTCGSSACGGCQVVVAGCGGGCGAGNGCGADDGCGADGMGAGDGCGTTTVTKKVWVPNVVTETVPVTTSSTKDQVVQLHRLRTASDFDSLRMHHDCLPTRSSYGYEEDGRLRRRTTHTYA